MEKTFKSKDKRMGMEVILVEKAQLELDKILKNKERQKLVNTVVN
jgi:hypothetical protein